MEKSIIARRCLTISDKQEILKAIDRTMKVEQLSASELSHRLNLPRSTISTIINKRSAIESTPITELSRVRSRAVNRKPRIRRYEELEERLEKWLREQDPQQMHGKLLREKAKSLAEEMEIDGFTASNGWFDRFTKRSRKSYLPCQHVDTIQIRSSDFLDHVQKIHECSSKSNQYETLSNNLSEWENLARSEGIKITRTLLKDMAFALAGALDCTSFTASDGWLAKYQKQRSKHCDKCQKIHLSLEVERENSGNHGK